jgi:hypothetical protein
MMMFWCYDNTMAGLRCYDDDGGTMVFDNIFIEEGCNEGIGQSRDAMCVHKGVCRVYARALVHV